MPRPAAAPVIKALGEHARDLGDITLAELFANNPDRVSEFTLSAADVVADFSKQRITPEGMRLLGQLARAQELDHWRQALFAGGAINVTEKRPALHVALRDPRPAGGPEVEGKDVLPEVHAVLGRMRELVESVRGGRWRGFAGDPIRDVVNLGIGGSDLGPRMAARALAAPGGDGPRVHFVSNVDGAHLFETLTRCRPGSTLFVIASKTFTTLETMANAKSARAWLTAAGAAAGEGGLGRHFVAVTARVDRATAFGVEAAQTFAFWDWVGGRFSLWSAIGLPVALAAGMDAFCELLAGAHQMDQHFISAPIERNVPVWMALLGLWNQSFLGAPTYAVLPYDQRLEGFVPYLQQMEMESNGKSVCRGGEDVPAPTAPIVWGAPGTDGQHAFFQLLHQGSQWAPCDFIGARRPAHPLPGHHRLLLANMLAQAAALMTGKSAAQAEAELTARGVDAAAARALAPHRRFPGNRPSTTLLLPDLSPRMLGQLCALYEHKVFCQGVLWDINSFDQFGVELGKDVAGDVLAAMDGGPSDGLDASTRQLVALVAGR